MSYELVNGNNKDLAARFTNGRFTLRIPKLGSSVDEEVRRFLDEEAVKLLDVLGKGPLLYTHDNDILTRCLRGMHKSRAVAGDIEYSKCTDMVCFDGYEHTIYYLSGGVIYLGPEVFSMALHDVFVPVLAIRESGHVEEMITTAHSHAVHSWEGLAKDRVLFESLKDIVQQDPAIPLIRIESSSGPIMFYKPTHKLGGYARKYIEQHHPWLLEAPR